MEILSTFYKIDSKGYKRKFALSKCPLCFKEIEGVASNIIRQKSCGCNKAEIARKNGKTRTTEKSYTNSVFNAYKHSAAKRKILFEMTCDDVEKIIKQPCAYCGSLPTLKHLKYIKGKPYPRNGIDRTDSKIGYVKGNLTPCCDVCNIMKNTLTTKEFYNHIKKIYEHLS